MSQTQVSEIKMRIISHKLRRALVMIRPPPGSKVTSPPNIEYAAGEIEDVLEELHKLC